MADEKLSVGNVFSTFDSFETCLKDLCQETGHVFVKKSAKTIEATNKNVKKVENHYPLEWRYLGVSFLCKHFGTYQSQSTGARSRQE